MILNIAMYYSGTHNSTVQSIFDLMIAIFWSTAKRKKLFRRNAGAGL